MQTTTMQARMRHPVFVLPDAMQALQALAQVSWRSPKAVSPAATREF